MYYLYWHLLVANTKYEWQIEWFLRVRSRVHTSSSSSILSLSQCLSRACWCESYCLTQRWRHSLLSPLHSLLSKAVALITGSHMTGARTRVEERCRCWGHQDVGHLTTCKPFLPPSPYWYQLRGGLGMPPFTIRCLLALLGCVRRVGQRGSSKSR